jgi:hypothetical protein
MTEVIKPMRDEQLESIKPYPEPLGDGCYYITPYGRAVAHEAHKDAVRQILAEFDIMSENNREDDEFLTAMGSYLVALTAYLEEE